MTMETHFLVRIKPRPFPLANCRDCNRLADHYMVHDDVWHQAFPDATILRQATGVLCFECLEVRLGRKLRLKDFQHKNPMNRSIFLGAQMAAEKTTEP